MNTMPILSEGNMRCKLPVLSCGDPIDGKSKAA